MITSLLSFLLNAMYLSLRLSQPGSFPRPLNAAEERRCLELTAKGDMDARNKLIEHNLRLISHIIKKYYSSAVEQEDLISIGTIGLIKAINSFDLSKNTRLATYAARCVENEIFMYFRSLRRINTEVSLSEPIDSDKDGNPLELMDILCFDECMLERVDTQDKIVLLTHLVNTCLDERERKILILRYGLGNRQPLTQREVAEISSISRSYVSRIEKRALGKLTKAFSLKGHTGEDMID